MTRPRRIPARNCASPAHNWQHSATPPPNGCVKIRPGCAECRSQRGVPLVTIERARADLLGRAPGERGTAPGPKMAGICHGDLPGEEASLSSIEAGSREGYVRSQAPIAEKRWRISSSIPVVGGGPANFRALAVVRNADSSNRLRSSERHAAGGPHEAQDPAAPRLEAAGQSHDPEGPGAQPLRLHGSARPRCQRLGSADTAPDRARPAGTRVTCPPAQPRFPPTTSP